MLGEIITWFVLGIGFIAVLGIAFIMWLNARSSSIDDRAYDNDFKPGEMVSKYRWDREEPEDSFDPAHALRHYAHHDPSEEDDESAKEDERLESDEVDGLEEFVEVPHPNRSRLSHESHVVDIEVLEDIEKPALPAPKKKKP